jgi:hypothetical protein
MLKARVMKSYDGDGWLRSSADGMSMGFHPSWEDAYFWACLGLPTVQAVGKVGWPLGRYREYENFIDRRMDELW